MSKRQPPPATLPADFFDKKEPPATLPADFFDAQPAAAPRAPMTFGEAAVNVLDANPIVQGIKGIGKEIGETGMGIVNKLVGYGQQVQLPGLGGARMQIPSPEQVTQAAAPQNTMESIGKGIGSIAEFAGPSSTVSGVMKAAPLAGWKGLLANMGAEGAVASGVGMAQGQSPAEAGVSGVIASAIPVGGKVWPAAKDFVARKVSPRLMNNLMEVSPSALEFGHDPGGRIIKEGIIAPSEDALLAQIRDRLKSAGTALDAKLVTEGAGKTIDAREIVVKALDNAVEHSGFASEAAFQGRIEAVTNYIMKKSKGKLANLTPKEAQTLKSDIGSFITWNGDSLEKPISKAVAQIYRGLNMATEQAVPGAKALLSRYGDLKVAEDSLAYAIRAKSTRPLASGQGPWATGMRMLGNTPTKTFGTQVMERLMNPNQTQVAPVVGRGVTGGLGSLLTPSPEPQ